MEEGGNMVAHIAELRQIQNYVATTAAEIGEDEFMALMATSLPESWDAFTHAYFGASGGVSQTGQQKITSQELAAVLIDEDQRRKGKSGTDAALYSRSRPPFRNQCRPNNTGNGQNVKCFSCGRMGHMSSDCRSKQKPALRSGGALIP